MPAWTNRLRHLSRVAALVLTVCASSQFAAAAEKQAAFVVDGNTGAVLHEQHADEPRYPASLTKMMTLYLAFEAIESGQMSGDTMLTVSVACASMAPSKLDLDVGERISLDSAMKAVVTKSANDMACAIAEAIAGTEAAFARLMTKRARSIGMAATTFRNASGLPDPGQITTARDMVTLGLRLRDNFPKQFSVFQLRAFSYGGKTYKNHNTLMNGFGGMDGIKTGYTRASGFNLVSSVQRDGKYVVGAVFGGVSASVRNAHMRVILFHALAKASTEKTRKAPPLLIARARPAKPPKVAVAEAPPAPRKPSPKPVAEAPKKAADDAKAASPQPPSVDPAIKIAKVRAVMVAGAAPSAVMPAAAAPTAASPAAAPNVPVAQPAKPKPQFVTASATPRLKLAENNAPDSPAATKEPAPIRSPGSLNAQREVLQKTAAVAPPAPAQATAAGVNGYLIQVGAFASAEEAQRHLDSVRGRAEKLLRDRPSRAEQAQVGSRQVYRARFAAFDSASANAACTTLRQQKVDCLVFKGQ
jgi:D-alanyl-D-alanine carboxypeptidase